MSVLNMETVMGKAEVVLVVQTLSKKIWVVWQGDGFSHQASFKDLLQHTPIISHLV
jgi:hypothetical protein